MVSRRFGDHIYLDNLGELTLLWFNFILGLNFISFVFGYGNV